MPSETEWLNQLIALLQTAQLALLQLLQALGLAGALDGQPAWPFAQRLSGENLVIDAGQARMLAWALALLAVAGLLALLALVWRRARWPLVLALPLLLLAAPWPDPRVLLVPATPASFHASPTRFSAASIAQGRALYGQHCLACHGSDGRGQGPLAARQAVWPPSFAGPLLWRRADGDLWWHILHGVRDRAGQPTMPGFAATLRADDAWALIDYLKAQGAGQALRASGGWPQPVAVPDAVVRCEGRPARPLSAWHGQRLRLVVPGPAGVPQEDPRLVTVVLAPGQRAAPLAAACVADGPEIWQALALLAGLDQPQALAGTQFLADRDGWLRARSAPGMARWNDDDLLCRTGEPAAPTGAVPSADGLAGLIARMDAQVVRFVKGGFVH